MSSIESFLKTNLSLCNKNNPISITYGMHIHPNIFDTRISKNVVQNIINIIKSVNGSSNFNKEHYSVVEYLHNNEILSIESCKDTQSQSYSIINEDEFFQHPRFLLQKLNIKKDDVIPHSGNYHSSINYNKLILSINQSSTLEIKDFFNDNYYTLSIVIKKPTTYDTIIPLINKLINLDIQ